MTVEGAEVKGRRMLTEGRLTVTLAGAGYEDGVIAAECKGDSGAVYELGYSPRFKEWSCSCPALGKRCSHLVALKLVVTV